MKLELLDSMAEIEWEEFMVGGDGSFAERAAAPSTTEWVLRFKLGAGSSSEVCSTTTGGPNAIAECR